MQWATKYKETRKREQQIWEESESNEKEIESERNRASNFIVQNIIRSHSLQIHCFFFIHCVQRSSRFIEVLERELEEQHPFHEIEHT